MASGTTLQVGLPSLNEHALGTLFTLDPRVKEEYIWPSKTKRRVLMLKRDEPSAWLRNAEGNMVTYPFQISKYESVLSQIIDPHLYPEISAVREQILSWRFYHHFRTDVGCPLRQPQIGVYTPVLSHDGSDLAASLQTVLEIGDATVLRESVGQAFGGAELHIEAIDTLFNVNLQIPGLLPEYLLPENLERLRNRSVSAKRSLALREFALGTEALERFVRQEPLRRVHECAFWSPGSRKRARRSPPVTACRKAHVGLTRFFV